MAESLSEKRGIKLPLHLIEGFDLWEEEQGKADVILLCGSYGFKGQNINLTRGYGKEAVKAFDSFSTDMWNWFKFTRAKHKKMAAWCYGVALPKTTDYGSGTLIGLYQVRQEENRDLDVELLKFSINMIKSFADQHYRIALEYPCKEIHGANEELTDPVLARLPESCVFYRASPPAPELNYASIGSSYVNQIKYGRTQNPKDFHRR